jgi:hypothetical protein
MAGARAQRGKEAFYAGLFLDRSGTFWQPTKQLAKQQRNQPKTLSEKSYSRRIGSSRQAPMAEIPPQPPTLGQRPGASLHGDLCPRQ